MDIAEKYNERIMLMCGMGYRFCYVDRQDIEEVKDIFVDDLSMKGTYYLSTSVTGDITLNWE